MILVRFLNLCVPPGLENREIRNIKSVEKRNQQDPTAIAQGTLLNVKWQPGWEVNWGENGHIYTYS